eukprot:1660112-Pyramimonas_sp.AAC.1
MGMVPCPRAISIVAFSSAILTAPGSPPSSVACRPGFRTLVSEFDVLSCFPGRTCRGRPRGG